MNALCTIAGKEIRDGLRNRWAVTATLVLAGLSLALAFLGSAPTGHVGVPPLAVTVVSLASLTVFLVPLIALILSYDALIGEVERGTMLLLLTYPVRRWQIVAGKFLGHGVLLGLATIIGYGVAGLAIALLSPPETRDNWLAFVTLIATSVALGIAFLALGYLVSSGVREHATAAGIAVGLWLFLVLLFDMGLLGVLAATEGRGLAPALFRWILMLDPTDIFRLINLASFTDVRNYSGMAGLPALAQIPISTLVLGLLAWIGLPLSLTMAIFTRRPL
ncbi:ABC transporter permease subunit [Telmatospirillum sp.]|uniref:ABC transporter permease n=1 Tax=Telmatospirillum sp. TaxID=2079197 RepID=UPI00283C6A39|nr:ABC transporter permease subunit [Telmatospirillum sp.]MDR3439375.1 ABC transporter permease subunit [Telmatospirillum sp.]